MRSRMPFALAAKVKYVIAFVEADLGPSLHVGVEKSTL
ncbi:hypothetical protein ABIA22_004713 [Sinorhizobium fredii]